MRQKARLDDAVSQEESRGLKQESGGWDREQGIVSRETWTGLENDCTVGGKGQGGIEEAPGFWYVGGGVLPTEIKNWDL